MTRSALRIAFVVASLVALSVALAVACLALLLTPQAATAQKTVWQNTPGQFDFYVLSLPWSPSF
jgi:ribonuclease I